MLRLRLLEWVTSFIILSLGLIMWFAPQSFLRPGLAAFAESAPTWTLACLLIGAVRLVALYINGHWAGGTPLLRFVGSIMGAGLFGAFVGNLIQVSTWSSISFGVATYTVLLIAELISSFFSGADVFHANKNRT